MRKILLPILLVTLCISAYGAPTRITVRAKAKDAKFIGDSMGGVHVVIREQLSGRILASGMTSGGTGNTDLIMNKTHERYSSLADAKTSGYTAVIDIDEPTFVKVEIVAPVNRKQARIAASTELWLIPGKHILGDGIVLEVPGFVVEILNPTTHQFIPLASLEGGKLQVRANVVMMCGCTISKGGLWDSEKMEVAAILKRDGKKISEAALSNTGPNSFEGVFDIPEAGTYELIVYAYDPRTGNTGVDRINYLITG